MAIERKKTPYIIELKREVLKRTIEVCKTLLKSTRSRTFSIKLKTLIRYGYISYVRNTTDINILKGLMSRLYPPREIVNQHFYRELESALKENFDVKIKRRGSHRYAIFIKS
ncbi:MAG: hypothetical protein DRJ38_05030 [Thermoprotei archaeon]|nr:MAG: hypothetical protein DRJ38_05030 [Thermoprotei archaeon]